MRRSTATMFSLIVVAVLIAVGSLVPPQTANSALAQETTGLHLWNSLDSPEAVVNSLVGPALDLHEPASIFFPAGQVGNALATEGGDVGGGGYLTISEADLLPPDRNRGTVEVWIQKRIPRAIPYETPLVGIFGWQPYGELSEQLLTAMAYWSDGFTGDGGLQFELHDVAGGTYTANDLGWDGVPVGRWSHVAFVWDSNGINASEDRMRIYRDGQIVAVNRMPMANLKGGTTESRILGHHAYARLGEPMAYLDELKVWDYPRTDFAEIIRPQDRMLVIDGQDQRVLEYDALSGEFVRTLIPTIADVASIQDLAVGPDGNLYLSVWSNPLGDGSVRRYNRADGTLIDTFVPSGSGGLSHPDELLFGPEGLYVSDRFSGRILRYDALSGAYRDTIVADARLTGFIAFSLGPDGAIYASMFNPIGSADPDTFFNGLQCVLRYDGNSGAYIDAVYCPQPGDIDAAAAELAFHDDGLYIARYHAGQVVKVDPISRDVYASYSCPGDDRADAIGFGPDGMLYVSNFGDRNLRRITLPSGSCQEDFFSGGAIGITGRFLFTDAVTALGRVSDGLLALYDFDEGSGAIVYDRSGVGDALNLRLSSTATVEWNSDGLRIVRPMTIRSERSARKINTAVINSNEISIELWVISDPQYVRQSGRVVTISANETARNITLTQGVYDLNDSNLFSVRIHTDLNNSGYPALNLAFSEHSLRHIVYTRSADGTTRIYDNGVLQNSGFSAGTLATWQPDHRLVLANENTGKRPWIGTYSLLAVYERALSAGDIQQNYAAGPHIP